MSNQMMLSFALGPDLTKAPSLFVRGDGSVAGDTGFERVAGFVRRLDVAAEIAVEFDDFWEHPERSIGTYVLLADAYGFVVGNLAVVERVTVVEIVD